MPTSSSVPEMIHALGNEKTTGHQRKHSNSMNEIEASLNHDNHHDTAEDSFDDSTEDVSKYNDRRCPTPDYDVMPPPPPPPEILEDNDLPYDS